MIESISTSVHAIVLVLLSAGLLFGQGEVLEKSLTHDGADRSYKLYVPSSYSANESMPLVLNIHGLGGNANHQMVSTAMNPVAEREGFLVAYPNAAVDGDWAMSADHSVSFFDSLLDSIQTQYRVDDSRIFSTGREKRQICGLNVGRIKAQRRWSGGCSWLPEQRRCAL